jgi:hypothetical protein
MLQAQALQMAGVVPLVVLVTVGQPLETVVILAVVVAGALVVDPVMDLRGLVERLFKKQRLTL